MTAQPVSARIACACAAFAVLAAVAAGCGSGGGGSAGSLPAGVVARVGGEDVTQAQVDGIIAPGIDWPVAIAARRPRSSCV